ncbi:hypothetical protein PROFUN_11222 [Planoprotostelium fungivorum]|uniref:Cell wall surface anchor family protein n=1 Tax=Planoprotostelium fungivorum TaxID=1890364 RepID=A0A2P6NA34_9EUKA|nr:hypothetical protein PROFUN_11222 [Planoprotostelium fungivorum]
MYKAAFLLLAIFALASAQLLSATSTQTVTAGNSANFKLGGTLAGLTAVLPSVDITSNVSGSITVTLTVSAVDSILNSAGAVGFSGGLNLNANNAGVFADASFASSLSGIFGSISNALLTGLSLSVKCNGPATITISGSFGALAASGQVGLFVATTDYTTTTTTSGGSSTTTTGSAQVYGAVPYSIAAGGQTYTYTLNVPASGNLNNIVIKPFTPAKAASSNNGGTAASTGSGSFSTAAFIPVALGYDFNLQGGQQYAFGNNIQVTPTASSGSAAGTLNVKFNGLLTGSSGSGADTTASQPPNNGAKSNLFLSGSYQFTGSSNTNNVIQFSAPASSSATLFTNVTVNGATSQASSVSVAAAGEAVAAKKVALSWFKSTAAGAAATGSAWVKVASTSTYDASAGLKVYATVSSYSQWTVAADSAANGLQYAVGTLLMCALLVLSF